MSGKTFLHYVPAEKLPGNQVLVTMVRGKWRETLGWYRRAGSRLIFTEVRAPQALDSEFPEELVAKDEQELRSRIEGRWASTLRLS